MSLSQLRVFRGGAVREQSDGAESGAHREAKEGVWGVRRGFGHTENHPEGSPKAHRGRWGTQKPRCALKSKRGGFRDTLKGSARASGHPQSAHGGVRGGKSSRKMQCQENGGEVEGPKGRGRE